MKQRQQYGFTLIELMITVAITGILAAIAYPSYQDSVMKSRRADAKGALLELANSMERHFTVTSSYLGASSPVDGETPYYNLTIKEVTANSYTLNAEPIDVQSNDKCGTLSLDHTGLKDNSTDASVTDCW